MKTMIVSDIHGSSYYCKRMMERYNNENPERIICLGDILYHGPRNDLPKDYNPKEVIEMLNGIKDKIISVRGNCDAEVDQMVLKFPIMADYAIYYFDEVSALITHGHIYNENNMLDNFKILLHGHTHVPCIKKHENYVYLNPGSISIPKNESKHSYMIYENKKFVWKDLDGQIYMEYDLCA